MRDGEAWSELLPCELEFIEMATEATHNPQTETSEERATQVQHVRLETPTKPQNVDGKCQSFDSF